MKPFAFFEHTADIEFCAYGTTLEELFCNCARALAVSMQKDRVKKKEIENISLRAKNKEQLLYKFLEEFLFLFDAEQFLLREVGKLTIRKKGKELLLSCNAYGDNASSYPNTLHLKSPTYHRMLIEQQNGSWTARVVLDV